MPVQFSVCIPCWPRDTDKLKRCIRSVENQTLLPIEVIVGHSEMSTRQACLLEKKLKSSFFPVRCVSVESPQRPGANRNLAARHVNRSATHVAFFDADDIMHPRKLEITANTIKKYPRSNVILHRFIEPNKTISSRFDYDDPQVLHGNEVPIQDIPTYKKSRPFVRKTYTHHGHSTVRAPVLKRVQFREDLRRAEDCIFILNVVVKYGPEHSITFINLPLSVYQPARLQNNK